MKKLRFNYQWSYLLLWICLISGVFVAAIAGPWGVPVVAVGIVQAVIFYRCPNCEKSLLNHNGILHYCPYCGAELFKGEE